MSQTRRFRVLLVASHPTQYAAPLNRRMAMHPRLEIQVAYCSLRGAQPGLDPDFGRAVAWDVPLLDGYPWVHLQSLAVEGDGFWSLTNPGLWDTIRKGGFDAVVVYTGYVYASFWIALAAARRAGAAILFGTDGHELRARDGARWKERVKRILWPRLFGLADVVIVPSSGGVKLMESLGLPAKRVVLTPYTVDNDWWTAQASRVDRPAVRATWRIPADATVVLFCAKLQPWKRPGDLLCAFAQAGAANSFLVYAGDGASRESLEREAQALGCADRVRFLGFANQSELPAIYTASDLLVLPSEYEPFGVVVNEAMLCGCPAVVSDRVGARFDLVSDGETGAVFPAGDVDALARILRGAFENPDLVRGWSRRARARMQTWTPQQNIEALAGAVETAVARRQGS